LPFFGPKLLPALFLKKALYPCPIEILAEAPTTDQSGSGVARKEMPFTVWNVMQMSRCDQLEFVKVTCTFYVSFLAKKNRKAVYNTSIGKRCGLLE
jgi:hypothetical protein